MRYAKLAASALMSMAGFLSLPANAELILKDPVSKIYQQTTNSPCIFGGPSCQNPDTFGYSPLPQSGNSAGWISSSSYTVQEIVNLVGTSFLVGIDINTTATPATEKLEYFTTYINGALSSAYSYSPLTAHQFSGTNNGNGYADATLGLFDLTGLASNTVIRFEASLFDTTDGVETFFLIRADGGGGGNAIPEPGTTAIIGLGLLGMGFVARRKRDKQV